MKKYIIDQNCELYKDKDENFLINLIHKRCPEWYENYNPRFPRVKIEPSQIKY